MSQVNIKYIEKFKASIIELYKLLEVLNLIMH